MFGKKKLTAFDADYINNLLKQVHESETIVNRTTNPTVFFGRLNFLFDCLLILKDYEKYDIFHPEKPSDVLKNITKNLESHVNGFIDRAYTEKKKKIASLKTQTAKTNNWEKFFDSMFAAFELANTFWTGNGKKEKHYNGVLYTKGNLKHLKELEEKTLINE